MAEKRRNPRKLSAALDLTHVVIGGLVVVLSVIAFLNPEEHLAFFPAVFFLAALLSLINGIVRFRTAGRDGKLKVQGIAAVAAGILCAGLGVVSAVLLL